MRRKWWKAKAAVCDVQDANSLLFDFIKLVLGFLEGLFDAAINGALG